MNGEAVNSEIIRKNIITISGTPGSGKSTVVRKLKKKLKFELFSIGDFVEELAKKEQLGKEEFYEKNKVAITGESKSLDEYLDKYQANIGNTKDNIIIDSRLGFHFIPESFKVSITCDLNVSAERNFRSRKNNPSYSTIEKAKKTLQRRIEIENINFQKYGIPNFRSKTYYDLVIDSSRRDPEKISEEIVKGFQRFVRTTSQINDLLQPYLSMSGEIYYVSFPLTGGKKFYLEGMKDGLYDYNAKEGEKLAEKVKQHFKASVIVPGRFKKRGWSQRDFMDFWKGVIPLSKGIILHPEWNYAKGCSEEYLFSKQLKKLTLTHDFKDLTVNNAFAQLNDSISRINHEDVERFIYLRNKINGML